MSNGLSEQDLLANLLYATSYGRQGEETAERLLRHFGSLKHVYCGSRGALMKHGLSEAQAALLMAMHPIARRCALEELGPAPNLLDEETLRQYVRALYVGACNERFVAIALDGKGRFIEAKTVAQGTMREIPLQPRTLLDFAVQSGASSVIFVHNHPGGQGQFSRADIQSTQIFANYLRSTGISLLDHLLYSRGEVVSMRRSCHMPEVFARPEPLK